RAGYRAELGPLLRAEHPEAVRLEPGPRLAVDNLTDRELVDAEVVPVHQVVEVVEAEAESRVLRLVRRAGRVPALTLDGEDLVAGPLFGVADVPPHEATEGQRDLHVRLRSWATRVPGLAVVLEDVDELVDRVLDLFPVLEVALELPVPGFDLRVGGDGHYLIS